MRFAMASLPSYNRLNTALVRVISIIVAGSLLWTTESGCLSSSQSGEDAQERKNIIFILVDDQTAGMLGYEGHPFIQTPNVDRLASDGVYFSNAFVTTSICAASRASIFTGRYERTHGYTFGTSPLSDKLLAESYPLMLRENGYRTGFAGKFGVRYSSDSSTHKMFDFFRPSPMNAPHFVEQPDGTRKHSSEIVGDHAVEFLSAKDERPFCLSISFNAVHAVDANLTPGNDGHYPYPGSVSDLYSDINMPLPRLNDSLIFDAHPQFLKESLNRERYFWRWDEEEKYQINLRAYFRMISGYDKVIGRILDSLQSQGLADNTVIIFTADNGYYMGNRGFAGKWSHYEESIRVPMVIYDPAAEKVTRNNQDHMVLNLDVPATILDYAEVEIPEGYEGQSLQSLVRGKAVEWRNQFFIEHRMDHPKLPKFIGVRGERYVYAQYYEQDPPFEYLHDLEEDPDQLKNYKSDMGYEEVLRQMRESVATFNE